MKNWTKKGLAILVLTIAASCTKDDKNTTQQNTTQQNTTQPSVIGKWEISQIGELNTLGQEQLNIYENSCASQTDVIEITSTQYTKTVYSNRSCEPSKEEDYLYTKEDNLIKFKLKESYLWYCYKIINLTPSQMKLQKISDKVPISGASIYLLKRK